MIVVYSQPNCNPCNQTKKFLENNHVEYEVRDITQDTDALDELVSLGYQTTPVIKTENDVWNGFNLKKLRELV